MRKLVLFGFAALVAACGGEDDGSTTSGGGNGGTPTLALHVEGEPAFLTGPVTVVVDAEPAEAFFGVEVSVGETRVATFDAPPFTFTLDSATFPDGAAELRAVGVLDTGGDQLTDAATVEFANAAPTLSVTAPGDGEFVIGSPSSGFRLRPTVTAEDGNGIVRITADAGAGEVEVQAGSGEVEIELAGLGTDFPHLPVTVTFRAVDGSGAEAVATRQVVPTNEALRFLGAEGEGMVTVDELWSIGPGRLAFRTMMDFYVPERDGTASFSLVGHMVQTGGLVIGNGTSRALFFTDFFDNSTTLWRVPEVGVATPLKTLPLDQNQYPVFSPFALSSGRLVFGYWDGNEAKTHLLVYEPDGTLAVDAPSDLQLSGGFVAEANDGSLLVVTGGMAGPCVQVFDAVSFTPGDCWVAPAPLMPSMFLLADDAGVVLTAYAPSQGGPPNTGLVAFDTAGNVAWTSAELLSYSDNLRKLHRRADGAAVGLVASTDPSRPSALRAWATDGTSTTAWQAPAGRMLTDYGRIGDDLIVASPDPTAGGSIHRIGLDGTVRWTFDFPGESFFRLDRLPGDALAVLTGLASGTEAVLRLLDPDGHAVWEVTLPVNAMNVLNVLANGDSLLLAYNSAEGDAHVYEYLGLADGERIWRHRITGVAATMSSWPLVYDEEWGLLVGPASFARDDAGTMKFRAGIVGLVP